MAMWGAVNSQLAWALLYGHMRHGSREHRVSVGSAHLVCVCWSEFMDWAAWEDLVGLFGMGLGLGCVFGGCMVRHVDFSALTKGSDVY